MVGTAIRADVGTPPRAFPRPNGRALPHLPLTPMDPLLVSHGRITANPAMAVLVVPMFALPRTTRRVPRPELSTVPKFVTDTPKLLVHLVTLPTAADTTTVALLEKVRQAWLPYQAPTLAPTRPRETTGIAAAPFPRGATPALRKPREGRGRVAMAAKLASLASTATCAGPPRRLARRRLVRRLRQSWMPQRLPIERWPGESRVPQRLPIE